MDKIIVENKTDLTLDRALEYVIAVIKGGRISDNGNCYCYHTEWDNDIHVSAMKNKNSDRFRVHREGK